MSTAGATQKLRDALVEFKALLARVDVPEASFQQWFERHPIVFDALGFRRWLPQPRFPLGDGRFLEPDFLVEDHNGVWTVFELKRHEAPVLKNPDRRTDFRADFSTYVQQCREYAIHFADAANRKYASDHYGINVQREVHSIVVASTDELTDHAIARDLLMDRGNRVELRTYSEILRTLLRQLDWTSIDVARRPGISMGVLGVFPMGLPEQVLFDFGKQSNRSRVSIGLQADHFWLSLVDADGQLQRWQIERPVVAEFANKTPLELLELEVGVSEGSLYVAAHHNRRCLVQQHLPTTPIDLDDLAGGMAVGTDVTGKRPSSFGWLESFAYMRTLAPSERLQIYDHLDEVYHHYLNPLALERPGLAVFHGNKWMVTAGHPLSRDPPKPTPDTTGPWGWWTSAAMTLDDGKAPLTDPRLGAQKILLPGMKG